MKIIKISNRKINELNLELFFSLSSVTQALHKRVSKICDEGGLTTSQFAVLDTLYHRGELTINEIIDSVQSTSGNMTVVIHNLEKNDFVVRNVNPIDKRSCLISITAKGRTQMEGIFLNHQKDLKVNFKNLTEEEKHTLMEILQKIT